MKRLTVLLSLLSLTAHANLTSQLDLESRFEHKLRSVVANLEPAPVIIVKVKLKTYEGELPGLNLTLADLTPTTEDPTLSMEELEKVEVRVISKRKMTEAMKATLADALGVPEHKRAFKFETMASDYFSAPNKNLQLEGFREVMERISQLMEKGTALLESALKGFPIFLALGFVGICFLALFNGHRFRSISFRSIDRLVEGLSNREPAPAHGAQSTVDRRVINADEWSGKSTTDRDLVQSLSADSVVALLSDCYWCAEDDYAAWVWNQLSTTQRAAFLERWNYADQYARSLSGRISKPMNHHSHPFYLKPIDFSAVSTDDLAKWIRNNPAGWGYLSPMRQVHIPLSLVERIRLGTTHGNEKAPALPARSATPRTLTSPIEISYLSELDELAILKNPAFIPTDLRKGIYSLAWVALLSPGEREELLAPLMAKDLAEIWVGPKAVLDKIEQSLSEKKLQMVKSLLGSATPTRNSPTMRYLVNQAVWMLEKQKRVGFGEMQVISTEDRAAV